MSVHGDDVRARGTPRTIGVLGGMGPEATILLMQRILDATPAADDADHIPLLVDSNTQVPSRIAHLIEGMGEDPAPVLAAMTRRLVAMGAAALAMPCNTAHSYAGAVRRAAGDVPFLDMVALTAAAANEAAVTAGPVGLLASPAVEKTAIFADACGTRGVIYPADRDAMLSAIRAVKSGRRDAARPVLDAAAAELAAAGAAVLVVGCSEFSLLSREICAPVPLVDSLDSLTEACVAFARAPAGATPVA
ncbi:cysteate racemase [Acuticoccus sediminis]|uniref:aspartate/glutamate racemase family protein n=1 Tax=Acuticoccus sediminis TaxID=2184697 RepID=UPI001CFE0FE0|nr:amino acid racemase [Acuticoccus sediminis]